MDELTTLLSTDIWVRWRVDKVKDLGLVTVLGPGETVRAEGRTVDLRPSTVDPAQSPLGRVARSLLDGLGDLWVRGYNWDFRAPGGGERLFAVRPRTSRADPNVFTVTAGEDTVIGTVSVHEHKFKRTLRPGAGTVCSYVPIHHLCQSSRATIVDGDRVLATVFHDRDTDAVARVVPKSGMISALDFGVAFGSELDVPTRVLALVAVILDTAISHNDEGTGESHPAPGTSRRSARKQEAAFSEEHHYTQSDRLIEKARRDGKEELAERLEKHHVERLEKRRRGS